MGQTLAPTAVTRSIQHPFIGWVGEFCREKSHYLVRFHSWHDAPPPILRECLVPCSFLANLNHRTRVIPRPIHTGKGPTILNLPKV